MSDRYFFGYGSLVDCRTHVHGPTAPAQARGWRRAWRRVDARPLAILTAVPDPDATIDGLIAPVQDAGWAALDAREAEYERHAAAAQIRHDTQAREIALYAVNPARMEPPQADSPIWLSYFDVVIHGYLTVFGDAGVDRFVQTTSGWEAPVLDDRAQPLYPRAQPLSEAVRDRVDGILSGLGARVMTP